MEITEIKLRKAFYGAPLEAVYSVTFDNELVVHGIKLVRKDCGLLVVMPARMTKEGARRDVVHPVTSGFRRKIEEQIVNYHNNIYTNEQ